MLTSLVECRKKKMKFENHTWQVCWEHLIPYFGDTLFIAVCYANAIVIHYTTLHVRLIHEGWIWSVKSNVFTLLCMLLLRNQLLAAHPNIRLFVMQGGLQSTSEAVSNAVPIVGIPIISDQMHNVAKIVSAGAGLKIDFKSLTKETILTTFKTVLNDPRQVCWESTIHIF